MNPNTRERSAGHASTIGAGTPGECAYGPASSNRLRANAADGYPGFVIDRSLGWSEGRVAAVELLDQVSSAAATTIHGGA